MALIFPRLAHNYIKRGYYPTDSQSIACIADALALPSGGSVRFCDPCCGEGSALAELTEHLKGTHADHAARMDLYGIEIDDERAWRAKEVLAPLGGLVAHADMLDVLVPRSSLGLLFLNPPYGDTLTDSTGIGDGKRTDRHEKIFCRRWFAHLQVHGILALLVPHYVIDEELATLIARHFDHVHVYLAPEQSFKQAIVMGVKRKPSQPSQAAISRILEAQNADALATMPDIWPHEHYQIPAASNAEFSFSITRVDPRQLEEALGNGSTTMWPKFRSMFRPVLDASSRRPLMPLSQWHLALALAAGQITGFVSSPRRTMLVKGATLKSKAIAKEYDHREDGTVMQTTIATDKFVPMIKAIDMTEGSEHYGEVFTIR